MVSAGGRRVTDSTSVGITITISNTNEGVRLLMALI